MVLIKLYLKHMTASPQMKIESGVIFGVSYWMSSVAKIPAPQVMEPLAMLGNPPSNNATVFSHKLFL